MKRLCAWLLIAILAATACLPAPAQAAILVHWKASDNDDAAWTNVNTDGGSISYTGSPLKKVFDMTGRGTTDFNKLGHYYTGGYAGAVGQRWIVWAAISSVSTTDAVPFGIQTSDTINSLTDWYVTESTALTPDGATAGTVVAGTYHKYELRLEAGGTLATFFDDAAISTGEAGNNWHTRTIRAASNIARIGGTTGNCKWSEFVVTDSNGLTPPVAADLTATATGTGTIELTWTENGAAINTDGFKIERSTVGGGSGFSQIDTAGEGETSYSDSGLSPGTTYHYRIRAYVTVNGTDQNSAYTSEASDTTDAAVVASGSRNNNCCCLARTGQM